MDCDQATTAMSPSSDILSNGSDDIEEDKDVPKIKFKISNTGGPSSSLKPMARVCKYCGKEFSNGKALGGHIRIHTQALKKQGMLKPQPGSRNEENNYNLDREAKRMCPIFPRVSYRGLDPHCSLSSYSSEEEDEEKEDDEKTKKKMMVSSIDLLKDLPNWSRTDKRGRGSTCEAARNLISLASAGSSGRISETLAESTLSKKHDIIIDRKGKALVLSSSSSSKDNNGPPPGERRRRRIRFTCSTCGRVFPTFQALGGHRSSHNNNNKDDDKTLVVVSHPPPPRSRTQSVSASAEEGRGPHRCDICRKNFPTGQALGGHKRCHWGINNYITGSGSNAKNNELDPEDEASEVGPDPGSRQDPMDIDLNKLPSMDVDEEETLGS